MIDLLDLSDLMIEVLRSTNKTKSLTNPAASGNGCETGNCLRNTPKLKQKGIRDVDQESYVDHVTTNVQCSQGESQLYIFEDNEAMI